MRVLYVALDDAPARAGWSWLVEQRDIASVAATMAQLPDLLRVSRADVVWFDAGRVVQHVPHGVAAALNGAGRPGWLLTGGAAALPALLGIEPVAPNDIVDRRWSDAQDELFFFDDFAETPRIRGHAAFRRHSLFDGLGSGTYTWWPKQGESFRAVTYRLPAWPRAGRVIAVERAFLHIQPDRATIWAYDAPRRILCIGAYLGLESDDAILRRNRERLLRNALRWASLPHDAETLDLHWAEPDPRTVEEPSLALSVQWPAGPSLPIAQGPLRLHGGLPDDPFTLAGRRALIAGTEGDGASEVWIHPLRVMQFTASAGKAARVVITPLGLERTLPGQQGERVERCAVLGDRPAALLEYESGAAARLRLAWRTDLRLMWPYAAGSLGALRWATTPRTLRVVGTATSEEVCFLTSHDVVWSVDDASADNAPALHITMTHDPPPTGAASRPAQDGAARFRLGIVARTLQDRPMEEIVASLADPVAVVHTRAAALARIRHDRLSVTAPDPEVGTAFEWAKARLDSYRVETPGVGCSLVAGYWTSRPGWNDGRPGYAWYFGRDAVWTALASLAVGDFDAVRDTIAFLAEHQDLSGKILHECTTSGSVHYDAADSTPLFVLLVARYHAWTGDSAFVEARLDAVRRAIDFCVATDTDGDGLIENTRIGHGWIEFGRLGGGKVTYYNAGIWAAALREMAAVFEDLGQRRVAETLRERARTARTALERLFWNAAEAGYALKAWTGDGGEWARDFTPTATHAVPLLLGVADPVRAGRWLDLVAGADFSAEWGVRMVPRSDPGFNPKSYHGGAVWPLYTGWVSWAEYAAGRAASAFRHWRATLGLAFEHEKGAWPEVLHGTERASIGVCPDQAWSTAMAVAPFVYGTLGVEPDATRGRVRLRPQPPDAWSAFEVRKLRVGTAAISLSCRRGGNLHTFRVDQDEGAVPLRVILEPAIAASAIEEVRIDGITANLDIRRFGERLLVPAQLVLDDARTIEIRTRP